MKRLVIVMAMGVLASTSMAATCGDVTEPIAATPTHGPVSVAFRGPDGAANFTQSLPTNVQNVVIRVAGPAMDTLVFNATAPAAGTVATTPFQIPVGPRRVFWAEAYSDGIVAYKSTKDTIDVTPTGTTVTLQLDRVQDGTGIGIGLQDYVVQVDDSATFVGAATATQHTHGTVKAYSVKVTYSTTVKTIKKGDPVPNIVVQWAADNPGNLQVGATSCTTSASGTCTINVTSPPSAKVNDISGLFASAGGAAAMISVTIK